MDLQRRNSPSVQLVLVHFHPVAVIRQAFAESAEGHAPWSRLAQHLLEVHADAGHVDPAVPAFAAAAALIAVAARKVLLLGFHVTESRHVNPVGAVAEWHLVF